MTRAQAAVFVYSLAAARVYHPGVYHTALSVPTAVNCCAASHRRSLFAHMCPRLCACSTSVFASSDSCTRHTCRRGCGCLITMSVLRSWQQCSTCITLLGVWFWSWLTLGRLPDHRDENLYRGQRALQQLESVWCSKMEPLTAGVAGQLQQLADAEGWHKLLPSLSADAARDCRVVRDFIVGNVGYVMPLAVPQLFLGVDIIDAAVQQRGDRTLQR